MGRQPVLRSDSRYLEAVETMPRKQLLELQAQRLLTMVSHAYERAPLVRKLWDAAGVHPSQIRTVDDFSARAPFLTKDDIHRQRNEAQDAHGGLLCMSPAEVSWMVSTTGTSGEPTILSHRWGGPGIERQAANLNGQWPPSFFGPSARDYWEMGLREGDYCLYLGYRMRGATFRNLQYLGAIPILLSLSPADMLLAVELSLQYRPTLWSVITPAAVRSLLAIERERGVDMADVLSSYKAIIVAGEAIGPNMRATFNRWGVGDRLYNQTGLGDVCLAQDCQEHDGCHAWEDVALVELVDPQSGAPIEGDGRGELVVTSLVSNTDALIRFRTGDLVDIKRGICGCGRTHARFQPIGRSGDEIVIGARSILPMDVWAIVESQPECFDGVFQLIRPQREMDCLRMRVGYVGQPDLVELNRRLSDAVFQHTGLRPEIELLPQERILASAPVVKLPRISRQ